MFHDYVRIGLTTLLASFGVAAGKVISALHRRQSVASNTLGDLGTGMIVLHAAGP
ncbi:hypothetical protein [Streptomyces avermitilis]|uniref:Uncharacterized protein n=1 Tax=Streptomyces avermitilis TaxID=33903 RepID=A0A4D4MAV8_STRAX|nr:hypothetical protein [Streptomyces avermitilis]GDY68577.1 hypothetical protein SAV14893_079700 [Streptomyces avermitilis]GDY71047.1 hypothetical protein SAV31267_005320 [Streptomyces avermitilis]